jgi:anti-sigma28 factor (negative regulator of flagellin synthesis)
VTGHYDDEAPMARQGAEHQPQIMDDERMKQLTSLRERLQRSEYEVDAGAVAEAIVARLLATRPGTHS